MIKRVAISLLFLSTTINSDLIIDGKGNTLELSPTSSLSVNNNSTLTLKNLRLKGLRGTREDGGSRLEMRGEDSKLVLDNVTIVLDGNYSFTQGSISFKSNVDITGTYTFGYESNESSTIQSNARLKIDTCTTFSYTPKAARTTGQSVTGLIEMASSSSELFLNGAELHVGSGSAAVTHTGLNLTKGTIIVDHKNTIKTDGTTISDGVRFGDGASSSNNVSFIIFPGASVNADNPNQPNGFVTRSNV